jgi:hypothetical protein
MAARDDSDREIRGYLQFLLKHGSQCHLAGCPTCSTLQGICDYAAARLFWVELYGHAEEPSHPPCQSATS